MIGTAYHWLTSANLLQNRALTTVLQHVAMVLDHEFHILMWNERESDLWSLPADSERA
jgi:hypothetical protein